VSDGDAAAEAIGAALDCWTVASDLKFNPRNFCSRPAAEAVDVALATATVIKPKSTFAGDPTKHNRLESIASSRLNVSSTVQTQNRSERRRLSSAERIKGKAPKRRRRIGRAACCVYQISPDFYRIPLTVRQAIGEGKKIDIAGVDVVRHRLTPPFASVV
jgi:hypothetical protein